MRLFTVELSVEIVVVADSENDAAGEATAAESAASAIEHGRALADAIVREVLE